MLRCIAQIRDGMMAGRRGGSETTDGAPMPAYRLDDQFGFVLRLAAQRHAGLFEAGMVEGLTAPQFALLVRLREVGPCSHQRLARLLHLDLPTVKGVIDRLTGRGFVLSADDPLDKRRQASGLTERGLAVADAAIEASRAITQRTLEPLTPKEGAQLVALLQKLT